MKKALDEGWNHNVVKRFDNTIVEKRCTITPEETDILLDKLNLPKTDPAVGRMQARNLRDILNMKRSSL